MEPQARLPRSLQVLAQPLLRGAGPLLEFGDIEIGVNLVLVLARETMPKTPPFYI